MITLPKFNFVLLSMLMTLPITSLLAGETTSIRIGVVDSMATVFCSTAKELGKPIAQQQSICVQLAKNEFESGQIVIEAPAERALREVKVTCGPLVRDGKPGAIWPNLNISLWQVAEVEAYDLWGTHQSLGWFPDPLLPLDKPLSVQAGQRQCVLVRFYAGSELAAGIYRSEIVVSSAGMTEIRLPVEVTVWDFALPVEQHFTLTIPIWGGQMDAMYPGSQTLERRRAYLDMLYEHRVAPFPLTEDEIPHAIERGVRDFNLTCFAKDCVEPEKAESVAKQAEQWHEKGWDELARTYVLLGDEAPRNYYPHLREQGKSVHEAASEVARCFTVSPEMIRDINWIGQQMHGLADTLILGISPDLTDQLSREVRAAGFNLWWYYVALHYYIPTDKAESRLILWRHWKYQVPGQLHWGMTYWGDDNIGGRDDKKWPEIPWDTKLCRSGDGYVVYPAPNGTAFWPSIRLEQLRDGIEDFEYFYLLEGLTNRLVPNDDEATVARIAANRKLLDIDESLVKSYTEYNKDFHAYRDYRKNIAQAILATKVLIEKNGVAVHLLRPQENK